MDEKKNKIIHEASGRELNIVEFLCECYGWSEEEAVKGIKEVMPEYFPNSLD